MADKLSWDEWYAKIKKLADFFSEAFHNGIFTPSAVIGISNGGLMAADLLGRIVFKGVPILSLWANHWHHDRTKLDQSCYLFDNTFNESTLKTLGDTIDEMSKVKILLVDDLVNTTEKIQQAEAYIRKKWVTELKLSFLRYLVEIYHI